MFRPRLSPSSCLAGLVPLLLLAADLARAELLPIGSWQCRMAGDAVNDGCSLPFELGNFQGEFRRGALSERRLAGSRRGLGEGEGRGE